MVAENEAPRADTGREQQLQRQQPRRLLPAPSSSTIRPPVAGPILSGRLAKRSLVSAACTACRTHKVKCNGERPTCRNCVKKNRHCHYATNPGETAAQALRRNLGDLRDQSAVNQEMLDLLRTLPESEAQEVLRRLRSGSDVASVLNYVRVGDLLLQMSVLPETRYRYEFPYRLEMPQEYLKDNPYLESLVYEAAALYSASSSSKIGSDSDSNSSSSSNNSATVARLKSAEYRALYLMPFHAAEVIDPLLTDAKPSEWTSVCKDDALMRKLLAVFFRCEYFFTSAFHKDYFLTDMAARRTEFCSSLLVNIVLAYSCVCFTKFANRAEYWNPDTLLYRFLAEAKRLWELEATKPRLTTIQAGILFNVFHNLCGLDEIGQVYRINAIALAHQLRIFDRASTMEGVSERVRKGRTFVAWSLYSWEALVAFSFMIKPLLTKPPEEPLPDPTEDPDWYGEVWVRYPLNQTLSPLYFGQLFKVKAEQRLIMNRFCFGAYTEDVCVDMDEAYELFAQLVTWYENLPASFQPRTIVLPSQLQLHIYYYNIILSIFEPLADQETTRTPSPKDIVAEALKRLLTLVRLYYLRHGFEAMDLFICIPLIFAAYKCTDAINDQTPASELETLRSTLILATKGLENQRRNYYLAEALYRVVRGRMRPQESALLKQFADLEEDEDEEKQALKQAVRSHWPVSVVKKKEDLDSHILANLVENYAHLSTADESNRGGPSGASKTSEP